MRIIEVYKIIFCSQSKKYKIIFRTLENDKQFILYFEAQYAKNIAMASENIISVSLSQYELVINLLSKLNMKLNKVFLRDVNSILNCILSISDSKNDDNIEIHSFIGDAIILSLKTFSNIYIDEKFLLDIENSDDISNDFYFQGKYDQFSKPENYSKDDSLNSKVVILESALNDCISKENYEAAAILRDRIKQLKKE